jgi:hypothetical protein
MARIQREWTDDEKFCRSHGIDRPPNGASYETTARRIRAEQRDELLKIVRVFKCDRRMFQHSYFERGGWQLPSFTYSVFEDEQKDPWEGCFAINEIDRADFDEVLNFYRQFAHRA